MGLLHSARGMTDNPGMEATLTQQTREAAKFDELADSTGESWWGHTTPAGRRRSQRRAAILTAEMQACPDGEVLEIGCGTGVYSRALLEVRPALRLVGCDISPRSIALAGERLAGFANARFDTQDITALAYEEGSFDVVTGNSILHHVPIAPTLREALRVLKPGGLLLCFEPNLLNPELAFWHHLPRRLVPRGLEFSDDERPFTRWAGRRHLEEAGFVDASCTPFDFLHPLVPRSLIETADLIGRSIERAPLLREISGSQIIRARKPS